VSPAEPGRQLRFPVAYEPVIDRAPIRWPGGARLAVQFVLNVEYFEPHLPGTTVNPAMAALVPDVYNHSWRDYGARAGVWRLMELFDRHGLPVSVALNADVVTHHPRIVEEIGSRGWEVIGHGMTNSRYLNPMDEAAERQTIQESLDVIEAFLSQRPRGWLGPGLAENWRTPALLEELGVEYVCDWLNDDEPYRLRTPGGTLISVPYSAELNDIHCFLRAGYDGPGYLRLLADQFEVLHQEGGRRGKVMTVPLHPFLMGHPFRAKYLDLAIQHMREVPDVWFCTGAQIVDAYRDSSG
jgi:peptidoglycan/xylan/chitin deacetylase (PgdA/CDA1 family)